MLFLEKSFNYNMYFFLIFKLTSCIILQQFFILICLGSKIWISQSFFFRLHRTMHKIVLLCKSRSYHKPAIFRLQHNLYLLKVKCISQFCNYGMNFVVRTYIHNIIVIKPLKCISRKRWRYDSWKVTGRHNFMFQWVFPKKHVFITQR